jgi:hypothetical protein
MLRGEVESAGGVQEGAGGVAEASCHAARSDAREGPGGRAQTAG